jgi:AcrR family transcriptional regulator
VESFKTPGRPRRDIDAAVFETTLRLVHERGYATATSERVAVAAGVAKTTIYRRWPTKGALIVDVLLDAFGGAPPLTGKTRDETIETVVRWAAAKIAEPGVGAAFVGVFSDAVSDAALRELLATRFQEPYRILLQEALGASEQQVLFLVDVVAGTLLHRMGITGEPMVDEDVDALVDLVTRTRG